jgi:hypothetical protein
LNRRINSPEGFVVLHKIALAAWWAFGVYAAVELIRSGRMVQQRAALVRPQPASIDYLDVTADTIAANHNVRITGSRLGERVTWLHISSDPESWQAFVPLFEDDQAHDDLGQSVRIVLQLIDAFDERLAELRAQPQIEAQIWEDTELPAAQQAELTVAYPQLDLSHCLIATVGKTLPTQSDGQGSVVFGIVFLVFTSVLTVGMVWHLAGCAVIQLANRRPPRPHRLPLSTAGLCLLLVTLAAGAAIVGFISGPTVQAFRFAKRSPSPITCRSLSTNGPGDNTHVMISGFRADSASALGLLPLPDSHARLRTYVALIPDDHDGVPKPPDTNVVAFFDKRVTETEIESILASGRLHGLVRRPSFDPICAYRERDDGRAIEKLLPGIRPQDAWVVAHQFHPGDSVEYPLLFKLYCVVMPVAAVIILTNVSLAVPISFCCRHPAARTVFQALAIVIAVAALDIFWSYEAGSLAWNTYAPGGSIYAFALACAIGIYSYRRVTLWPEPVEPETTIIYL